MSEPSPVAAASEPTAVSEPCISIPANSKEDEETEVGDGASTPVMKEKATEPQSPVKTILPEIVRLKNEQKALMAQKKKVQKELKNAEKRRNRLKKRARLLTDDDLIAVVSLRTQEKAAKLEASASSTSAGEVSAASLKSGKADRNAFVQTNNAT